MTNTLAYFITVVKSFIVPAQEKMSNAASEIGHTKKFNFITHAPQILGWASSQLGIIIWGEGAYRTGGGVA